MSSRIVNTPDLLSGFNVTGTRSSGGGGNYIPTIRKDLGPTILTKPSGFELSTNAFGNKRKKENVTQIYLHHTAGGRRADKCAGTVSTYNSRAAKGDNASTQAAIDANGHVEEIVPWEYVAWGQGVTGYNFNTIGMSIEIQALGYFKTLSSDGKTWYRLNSEGKKTSAPIEECAPGVDYNLKEIKYKGKPVYQKYTDAQIKGTVAWVKKWMTFFDIKWKFNQDAYDNMFPDKKNLSPRALNYEPGVYSHNSVKKTKSDIFPQKELIVAFKAAFK